MELDDIKYVIMSQLRIFSHRDNCNSSVLAKIGYHLIHQNINDNDMTHSSSNKPGYSILSSGLMHHQSLFVILNTQFLLYLLSMDEKSNIVLSEIYVPRIKVHVFKMESYHASTHHLPPIFKVTNSWRNLVIPLSFSLYPHQLITYVAARY